jgi:hypothetical protein
MISTGFAENFLDQRKIPAVYSNTLDCEQGNLHQFASSRSGNFTMRVFLSLNKSEQILSAFQRLVRRNCHNSSLQTILPLTVILSVIRQSSPISSSSSELTQLRTSVHFVTRLSSSQCELISVSFSLSILFVRASKFFVCR